MGFQPNHIPSRSSPLHPSLLVTRVLGDRMADPLDSSERVPIFPSW
jgi:hypothetical protein